MYNHKTEQHTTVRVNQPLLHATTWMNFTNIKWGKRGQTQE